MESEHPTYDESESDDEVYGIDLAFNANRFRAPDVAKRDMVRLFDTGKHWKWVKNGFNYGGYCPNKNCISHKKGDGFVTYCRGYGSIRPNEDVSYGVVQCKGCENRFKPTEFVIKRAVGSLNYAILGDEGVCKVKIKSIGINNCQVFGENVEPKWYSLMVFVLKKPVASARIIEEKENTDGQPLNVTWHRLSAKTESKPILMDPFDICFCLNSIKNEFQCGRLLEHTLRELRKQSITEWDIPFISIFKMGDHWYTKHNRRLWVFKEIGKADPDFRIPVKIIDKYQVEACKINTGNKGTYVTLRADGD